MTEQDRPLNTVLTAPSPTDSLVETTDTLAERQKTHGDFEQNAAIYAALRHRLAVLGEYMALPDVQRASIDMICMKLARICSKGGNPLTPDHWRDIAGYATLAERACSTPSQRWSTNK